MEMNYFEQLGREILQQKRLMDKLEEENRELRRQIADLKEGRGIFIKIGDLRIALRTEGEQTTSENSAPHTKQSDNATPAPAKGEAEETLTRIRTGQQPVAVETTKAKEVPFLEEVMLDEFASALTNPVPTPPEPRKAPKNAYEERWRLRQDLQNSYILE
jgi:hypothetical protein